MSYISQEEQMNLFPHLYDGYVPVVHGDWHNWETTGADSGFPVAKIAKAVTDPEVKTFNDLDKALGTNIFSKEPVELDDDLGLPIIKRESTFDKYGIVLDTSTSFGLSLSEWYEDKGFLTPKQIAGWKRFKEN